MEIELLARQIEDNKKEIKRNFVTSIVALLVSAMSLVFAYISSIESRKDTYASILYEERISRYGDHIDQLAKPLKFYAENIYLPCDQFIKNSDIIQLISNNNLRITYRSSSQIKQVIENSESNLSMMEIISLGDHIVNTNGAPLINSDLKNDLISCYKSFLRYEYGREWYAYLLNSNLDEGDAHYFNSFDRNYRECYFNNLHMPADGNRDGKFLNSVRKLSKSKGLNQIEDQFIRSYTSALLFVIEYSKQSALKMIGSGVAFTDYASNIRKNLGLKESTDQHATLLGLEYRGIDIYKEALSAMKANNSVSKYYGSVDSCHKFPGVQ